MTRNSVQKSTNNPTLKQCLDVKVGEDRGGGGGDHDLKVSKRQENSMHPDPDNWSELKSFKLISI